MTSILNELSDRSLRGLITALESGRLSPPFSSLTLAQLVPQDQVAGLLQELQSLVGSSSTAHSAGAWIRILLQQRERLRADAGTIELVMTGPEPPGTTIRDTAVVVRQMFSNASRSIWICGFAVYQGKDIFQTLAQRMTALPDLKVRMFLNVERKQGDKSTDTVLLQKFVQRFRETQWPEDVRLPNVYFDPRAVESDEHSASACLHAKFVIADGHQVFISSANFTAAAQQRNIEAGVSAENPRLAGEIQQHFQALIDHGHLKRLRW